MGLNLKIKVIPILILTAIVVYYLMVLASDDIRTIERNTSVLLNACNDIDLAVNTAKTKYMEIGRHRGMIANEHIRIGNNA